MAPGNITPLSKETLEEAKKLVNRVFPLQEKEESSDYWLAYSLKQSEKEAKRGPGEYPDARLPGYWVYMRDGKVIGIIGLYEYGRNAKNVSWVGWFCVDPDFRRQCIGSELLEYAIAQAKKAGKKYLRLYTTDDPNEADAQRLYEKKGFIITKRDVRKRGKYDILYRELKLQ
jgi:GNAT superfamily N-acetyltransferase